MKKLLLLIILLPYIGFAQWTQIGSDIDGNATVDFSGFTVSLSADGNIIAVGAPRFTSDGEGYVKIYENISGIWSQIGNGIDSDGVSTSLGTSLRLSSNGNIVAVGGYNIVRIYENISGVWTQIGDELQGENPGDDFGYTISLNNNGNILAVGSPNNDGNGNQSGSVRVFENISGVWTQIGNDIDGEFEANVSGSSIDLNGNGNIVAVGAPNNRESGLNTGHVRVFENISEVWTLIGSDIDGESLGDSSGDSVSLNDQGDIVAIASPSNNTNGDSSGAVRIYKNISNSWTKIGNDIYGESSGDFAGKSLTINYLGNIIALGGENNSSSAGIVRVYENISTVWTKIGTDIVGEFNSDGAGAYRHTISLNSDGYILAIGAPNNDGVAGGSGHVRVYGENSLSVTENNFEKNLSIYPNPSLGFSKILFGDVFSDITIQIFDILGNEVLKKEYTNSNEIIINTQRYSKGTYLVKVFSNKNQTTLRLVIGN